jgi:hypothetical protein
MKKIDSKIPRKLKPTLEDLLKTNQLVKGRDILEHKRLMDEAIEFEQKNRRSRTGKA